MPAVCAGHLAMPVMAKAPHLLERGHDGAHVVQVAHLAAQRSQALLHVPLEHLRGKSTHASLSGYHSTRRD